MLAMALHGMQGTPYVYQGEELGMTNVRYEIEEYRDIETLNMYRERLETGYAGEDVMNSIFAKGRDNARTPMQWSGENHAGFTDGEPWLKVNPNYREINAAEAMEDPGSVFHFYKKLIAMRKELPVFAEGRFTLLLEDDEEVFAYTRETENESLLVVCNFFGNDCPCPVKEMAGERGLLLCNYGEEVEDGMLKPYEARMYYMKK